MLGGRFGVALACWLIIWVLDNLSGVLGWLNLLACSRKLARWGVADHFDSRFDACLWRILKFGRLSITILIWRIYRQNFEDLFFQAWLRKQLIVRWRVRPVDPLQRAVQTHESEAVARIYLHRWLVIIQFICQIGHLENLIYLILQIGERNFFQWLTLDNFLSCFADLEFGHVVGDVVERWLKLSFFIYFVFFIATTRGEYFAVLVKFFFGFLRPAISQNLKFFGNDDFLHRLHCRVLFRFDQNLAESEVWFSVLFFIFLFILHFELFIWFKFHQFFVSRVFRVLPLHARIIVKLLLVLDKWVSNCDDFVVFELIWVDPLPRFYLTAAILYQHCFYVLIRDKFAWFFDPIRNHFALIDYVAVHGPFKILHVHFGLDLLLHSGEQNFLVIDQPRFLQGALRALAAEGWERLQVAHFLAFILDDFRHAWRFNITVSIVAILHDVHWNLFLRRVVFICSNHHCILAI